MFSETFAALWRARYGDAAPPSEIPALTPFLRHRSVRDFAPEPVPEDTVRVLFAAAQSAATSSHLQLWSAISVQDPARREAITKLCGDQKQVREAPWFFAFVVDLFRIETAARAAGENPAGLDYAEFLVMGCIDAALAAERFTAAAEAAGLGCCYIGGLRNDVEGVKRLLGLPGRCLPVFGVCLGKVAASCRAEAKPRLSQPAVWFRERYDAAPDTAEFDRRMAAFYASQGQKADVTWAQRSGKRVDGSPKAMTGRAVLREWMEREGFSRR
ncbi:MAG: nitroreductase family protein [Planctomycetia bacterium]|nr:nitroreductase family protein [Planctomycetia bacterium]